MRSLMNRTRAIGLLFLLLLASCGGDGGNQTASNGGVGSGGTGSTAGTVTGFGSLILDGVSYSSNTGTYYQESDNSESAVASPTAANLGDQVEVTLDAKGNPINVHIIPQIVGVVTAVSSNSIVVNGVSVQINTDASLGPVTYYTGFNGLSDITVGTKVEVHGVYTEDQNGAGYVQATRIGQLLVTALPWRSVGVVSAYDAKLNRFKMGGNWVQLTSGTQLSPQNTALGNGELVNVWSNLPVVGNAVTAGSVRIRSLTGAGNDVHLSGLVYRLQGQGQFYLSGIAIDLSQISADQIPQNLSNGLYVTVEGQPDKTGGALVASRLSPYQSQVEEPELKGTITNFIGSSSFTVRGVAVDASQATFVGGATNNLGNGVYVVISGTVSANVVKAGIIQIYAQAPINETVDLQGVINTVTQSPVSFTFTPDGMSAQVTVTLDDQTVFSNGTSANLQSGARIDMEGLLTGNAQINADSVSFLSNGGTTANEVDMTGQVYNYDAVAGTFWINNVQINAAGVAVQGGILQDGAMAEVKGVPSGSVVTASEIHVQ